MFSYNLQLAIKSLKDRPSLTLLMVAAIAIGLGLYMTVLTMATLSENVPLSYKSKNLYLIQLDNREVDAQEVDLQARMIDFTYKDTMNLMALDTSAKAQTFAWSTLGILNVEDQNIQPLRSRLAATTNDFFTMFDTPFLYGGYWSKEEDQNGASVIVLSKATNEYLFGGIDSVGKQLRIDTRVVTVVGVLDYWYLSQKFYDRSYSAARPDQAFLPSSFAFESDLPRNARFDCWSTETNSRQFRNSNLEQLQNSECAWITYWAEIEGESNLEDYKSTVNQYIESQKAFGRFPREVAKMNDYYTNINDQISYENGRNGMITYLTIVAYMFFAVCLVNAVSILLAKFMRRSKEVSLRRALGAKKWVIMYQHLLEVIIIGFMGGVVGVIVTYFGLQGMMRISLYSSDYTIMARDLLPYYQLNWAMIATAFLVAICSTIIVALYPIWRICNVSPASQLKAQ